MKNIILAIVAIAFVSSCNVDEVNKTRSLFTVYHQPYYGRVIEGPIPINSELGVIRVKTNHRTFVYLGAVVALSTKHQVGDEVTLTPIKVYSNQLAGQQLMYTVVATQPPTSQPATRLITGE